MQASWGGVKSLVTFLIFLKASQALSCSAPIWVIGFFIVPKGGFSKADFVFFASTIFLIKGKSTFSSFWMWDKSSSLTALKFFCTSNNSGWFSEWTSTILSKYGSIIGKFLRT